jgi:hypothetical protein
MHDSGVAERAVVLPGHADRQVVDAVVVEVADGEDAAEAVISAGMTGDSRGELAPGRVERPASGRGLQDDEIASLRCEVDEASRAADHELIAARAVEVSEREPFAVAHASRAGE